jgi:rare lipoprotein A
MRLRQQPDGLGRARLCVLGAASLVLANCSASDRFGRIDPRYGVSTSPRLVALGEPVPKGGGTYRIGPPYSIGGRTYVPAENPHYRAEGVASWYGEDFHGRQTANGEIYDMQSMSAAHATLPLPSYVRVTNLSNARSVIVRVNDRGPYHADRVIDVSVRAATVLGFYGSGLAPVRVEYVGTAPLEGSDDTMLMATLREGEPAPPPSLVRLASAKPLVPETPSRAGVLRHVPLPPDRPYSLGDGQMHSNYRPAGPAATVARAGEPDRDKPVTANGAPMRAAPPLSAYLPPRPDIERSDLAAPLPAAAPAASLRGVY